MDYRKYDETYLDRVADLLNICFPEKKISEKSFLWKHYDKFFENRTISMIAVDGGKVCSFVCFTPIIIVRDENIYQNFYSCAVQATHPNYRRQGLVSKLTQLVEKKLGTGAGYVGFSNDDGVKIDKFSKNIGYKILGQMVSCYVFSFPYKTNLQIKEADSVSWRINNCVNYFGIQKNNDYLDWRYTRNPKNKYTYLSVIKDAEIIGGVICKNSKTKYEVLELWLDDFDLKICQEMIRALAKYSLSRRKMLVSYSYLQNEFWSKCFPAVSLKNKISVYFTIKSKDEDFLNVNNWIIQGGDIQ